MRVTIDYSFCNQKSLFLLKKILYDIKYSGSDIFQESVLNDTVFMSKETKLVWLEDFFRPLSEL